MPHPRDCRPTRVLVLAQTDNWAGVSVRRLPQGAIASPLNHPERCEGCDQHHYPGHEDGPGAKASAKRGHHDGCRYRAHADCRDYCEHDNRPWCPRWIGHAETLRPPGGRRAAQDRRLSLGAAKVATRLHLDS